VKVATGAQGADDTIVVAVRGITTTRERCRGKGHGPTRGLLHGFRRHQWPLPGAERRWLHRVRGGATRGGRLGGFLAPILVLRPGEPRVRPGRRVRSRRARPVGARGLARPATQRRNGKARGRPRFEDRFVPLVERRRVDQKGVGGSPVNAGCRCSMSTSGTYRYLPSRRATSCISLSAQTETYSAG
jgi:hypothetical protein